MIKIYPRFVSVILMSLVIFGCDQKKGIDKEKNALLKQHRVQREAHMTQDAELFVTVMADTLISVQDGDVNRLSREDNLKRYQAYFSGVNEFLAWDDESPPVIRISEDGTLAWTIVTKRVRYNYYNEDEQLQEIASDYAWITTYEKRNGKWLITANVSTKR